MEVEDVKEIGHNAFSTELARIVTLVGLSLAFSPLGLAQTTSQSDKPSETAKAQDGTSLSHDLS
jgi:hypothetical protein